MGETYTTKKRVEELKNGKEFKNFRNLNSDEMPIGGYLGPALEYGEFGSLIKDETYDKLSKAGINYIVEKHLDYKTQKEIVYKALEKAGKYHIGYFILDSDCVCIKGVSGDADCATRIGSKVNFEATLNDLYRFDNFNGLYFRDEPTFEMLNDVGSALVAYNGAKKDKEDLSYYCSLFPCCDTIWGAGKYYSWDNYERYIQKYVDLGADHLMFDYYPYEKDLTVAEGYFLSIGKISQMAKMNGLNWIGYIQAGGGLPAFPDTNGIVDENSLIWNVFTVLAFGAKGILYYPLVCPPEKGFFDVDYSVDFTHSLLTRKGEETPFYKYAARADAFIKKIEKTLMRSKFEGIMYGGDLPCLNWFCEIPEFNELNRVKGDALIGCFDDNGKTVLLVVNNRRYENQEITLSFFKEEKTKILTESKNYNVCGRDITVEIVGGSCALIEVE